MHATSPVPADTAALDDARVLRALAVLEALASAGQPYTLSQLSVRLHIPKATLLRMIEALEARGYVVHMPDSRGYDRAITLGPRAAQLALSALSNNTFTRGCRAVLRALVDVLGETCNLTALDNDAVLYVERVETTEPGFAGDTAQGARKPATTETGLVVQVPLFVGEGDTIRVDTRTGEYQTRL